MNKRKTFDYITLKKEPCGIPRTKITSSIVSAEYIRQFYADDIEIFESMFILLLNNANMTIGYAKISQGGITGTLVDVKIVCKYALDSLAMGIILAHNHPSGTLRPSEADKSITQKVKQALDLIDVKILDHIILAPGTDLFENPYFSFADEGIL